MMIKSINTKKMDHEPQKTPFDQPPKVKKSRKMEWKWMEWMATRKLSTRWRLYLLNFVFAFEGLAFIYYGVMFHLQWVIVSHEKKTLLSVAPLAPIVVGAMFYMVACLGCCAAVTESSYIVDKYDRLLRALICIQALAVPMVFVFVYPMNYNVMNTNESQYNRSGAYVDIATGTFADVLHQRFHCCGYNGPQDYDHAILPDSCCSHISVLGAIIGGRCTSDAAKPGCRHVVPVRHHLCQIPVLLISIFTLFLEMYALDFTGKLVQNDGIL